MSWVLKLQKQMQTEGDVVPTGWKTSEQIAKELGRSNNTARRLLKHWISNGFVEMRRFKVKKKNGIFALQHYKEK